MNKAEIYRELAEIFRRTFKIKGHGECLALLVLANELDQMADKSEKEAADEFFR